MSGGRPYGSYLDRQSNPVAEQGGVYAGADYAVNAKIKIQLENRDIGPSAYGGADNEQVWNIAPDELLFTVLDSGGTSDIKMAVLGNLNGMGATATAQYGAVPGGDQIIREAVKNGIQVVGAAYQALEASRGNLERGVAVQMGGLKTLRMGNGEFGDERGADNFIKPGDIVCADVPMPGRVGLSPGPGGRAKRGVPAGKYTLQLRRCDPHSSGKSLRVNLQAMLHDPAKWQTSMGEHLMGTRAWASAVHAVTTSYLTAVVLGVQQLMAAGIMAPTALGELLAKDSSRYIFDAATTAVADLMNPAVQDESRALTNALKLAADEYAIHLAQLLRVVKSTDRLNIDTLIAGATVRDTRAARKLQLLRMSVLQHIFYDGTNKAFEFGFGFDINGLPTSNARYPLTGVVRSNDPAGELLEAQLNHFPQAVSGFHTAILNDLRFVIGKAATGASSWGSGNAHVFLGMCRQ